jgi:hypothetical protein
MSDYEYILALVDRDDIPSARLELDQIPHDLWKQALASVGRQPRFCAAQRVADDALRARAIKLVLELEFSEDPVGYLTCGP